MENEPTRKRFGFRLALLSLVIAGAVTFYFSPWRAELSVEAIRSYLESFSDVWYAPILFIAIYAAGCIMFLPASIFVVVAAVVWGWKLGGLYSIIGGSLGAFASFELSKYAVGDFAWSLLAKRGPRIAEVLSKATFRTLVMLRLVPLVPFPVYNYGAGLTAVRARDFYLSTVVGIAAPTFIIAYSGDALLSGELTKEGAFTRLLIAGGLLALLIGLPTIIRKRVGKEILKDSAEES